MKKQIQRFSPHQNGKVFAILVAIGSLPMFALTIVPALFMMPKVDNAGNPIDFPFFMFLFMPIFYLIFSYISVVFGCWLYNFFFKYIGGIEFEVKEEE